MTLEFQKNILRYLFQNSTDLSYISVEFFDTIELRGIYELLYSYVDKYKSLPDKGNFIEYISLQHILTNDAKNLLRNNLVWLYEPIDDVASIKEVLLSEVKKKLFSNLIKESIKNIDSITPDDISFFHKEIIKIDALNESEVIPGLFLLKDLNKIFVKHNKTYPTFLNTLNKMTAMGGFSSPELVVWMGPPKSFKTGFLIKSAAEFMKDGLNVYYADFENGEAQIHNRFKQCLLECHINEISSFNKELQEIKDKLLNLTGSGEVYIRNFLKRKDHLGTIDVDLDRLKDTGFDVNVIMYDYIDIMGCSDRSIKDPRLKIQHNYAEADVINRKYNTFCYTVSKMKQTALKKEWPTADDVAEDFEKIYNAHAVFAIMRNEEDIEEGLGRIIPIVQRLGSSYTQEACTLQIDPVNFIIKEI